MNFTRFQILLVCACFAMLLHDASVLAQARRKAGRDTLRNFQPLPDRWQDVKPPPYELNVKGHLHDPYNQNVLKGDFPIMGESVFMILTASTENFVEAFSVPTPSAVSTARAQNAGFFGGGNRMFFNENLTFSLEFYKGNTAFKPRDFEIKIMPVINLNYINTQENNDVNINVRQGTSRYDSHLGFRELFMEKHLFNLSRRYDFVSLKAGIQFLNSDFRGFIFQDANFGGRLFGSAASNRYQYNLAYFRMLEKDTNSEQNTVFQNRNQDVFLANLYKQDFLTPGYTAQVSLHYNHDKPSVYVDNNGVPVRPAIFGSAVPHDIKAYFVGWTGDGHWGRLNINHAFYQVVGRDSFNPLAGRPITINAQMAALELSLDKDWMRFKVSAFYASGDANPLDGKGTGFDTIIDLPFFAGGAFSYWNSQKIRLLGVNLTNKFSLVPDLRSSKFEGQSNFVNPGLLLFNFGYQADLTPKLRFVLNSNYLRFANTSSLAQFVNQRNIGQDIGLDYGLGVLYRPFLNNNAAITVAFTGLTPFSGFNDLYESAGTQFSFSTSLVLTY